MELYTDSLLHEKNSDARMPMASTTKIMTALIVIEDCELDEVITVPDQAVGTEGSSIYLKHDEEISIKDLLYGLMLRSGNDSAAALAIHHSGSIEAFAENMNRRAKEIGALNTNYTNPSGLPDDNHYTTAYDLCLIACTAMKNPVFQEIVGTKNYNGEFRSFLNKNKILNTLDGANGVKTGYTVKAGRCLVSSAQRDGMDVV
ncbi:MAG: D-alanyl-D-alanine carboxypeptidase family protein, partial [Candidatus Coproplasma sp.]